MSGLLCTTCPGPLFIGDSRQVNTAVFHKIFFNLLPEAQIGGLGEQAAGDLLGKSLLFIIWVADRHVQDSVLQALVFTVWMGLDHQGSPNLKSLGRQAGNIGSFSEVIELDKVMLCFDFAE